MTAKLYNIELTGETLNNCPVEAAISAFAKLFKMSNEQAAAVFAKAPYVIKENTDEITAKKFQVALRNANIAVRIVLATNSQTNKVPTTHSTQARPNKNQSGLAFTLQGQPDYAFLTVQLPENATIKVEASSMATMDTHIKMRTKAKGGLGRLFTGESLFINEFTAEHAPGEIGIAPGTPGDIVHRHLQSGQTLFLQNSAFLASSPTLTIETKLDIFKGIFSGAGLVLIKCQGPGDLWFNTYGAAIEIDVDGEYVVDTDKIIAWEEGLEYKVTSVGGYKSLFFSGEGLVCRFSGKGKLWVQTRSGNAFRSWAHWYRPVKSKG